MMRVLHFFKTFWPDNFGGIERTIDAVATSTRDFGVETTVLSLSPSGGGQSDFNGYKTLQARQDFEISSTGFSREGFGLLAREAAKADIVHYHFPWPYMDLVHFAVRHGKPSVVTYHSDIVKQRVLNIAYAPMMHAFLRRIDSIIATSPNYVASSPVLRLYKDKTEIIPIGLNDTTDQQDGSGNSGFLGDRPFVLFAGVLRYYKGLDVLLDASRDTRCEIVVLGAGPLETALQARVENEGLGNVHFVGALPDAEKRSLLRRCLAFVFPSNARSEAFGLSLVEAAMFSKPMISAEIGTGTSFINRHGQTGLVVPPNDPPALAAAINSIVDGPHLAAAYGSGARERYLELFTAQEMGSRHRRLYERLLSGRPS